MTAQHPAQFDRANRVGSVLETLGGAEVTHIFAHDIGPVVNTDILKAALPGAQRYCERSLLLARPWDVVCVLHPPENEYLEYLRSLGIGPESQHILAVAADGRTDHQTRLVDSLMADREAISFIARLVTASAKVVLNPYIASPGEMEFRTILQRALDRSIDLLGGNPHIVQLASRKHVTRAKALELGVPVPEGEVVELASRQSNEPVDTRSLRDAIRRHLGSTGRVIVRGSEGASGSSIVIVERSEESIESAASSIAERTDNRVYLIEAMLDLTASPNIMMHVDPGSGDVTCVGVTDQVLDTRRMHQGNVYPSLARTLGDMILSARRMCEWLQGEGYQGFVGFDFGEYVDPRTGSPAHFLAEINPRINAAVYPKALMEHINALQRRSRAPAVEAFLSVKVKTRARLFAEICGPCGHLFFDPGSGKGLVPFNTGCLEVGTFTAAILGKSRDEVQAIYERLETCLRNAEPYFKREETEPDAGNTR